jgi:lipid-A-disaccharide synthase
VSAGAGGERPFTVFLIAGEESGDQLGAGLMRSLRDRVGGHAHFLGVGGTRMAAGGLASLFPMEEIALHGVSAVLRNIPHLLDRIRATTAAVVAAAPDALVVIDSPDFNLRVAKRVHREMPEVPIVDYVSPSVWAWRAGRARKMAGFIDHLLAILPFEPEVHRRLGGPPCIYVGHPLIERLAELRPALDERPPVASATRRTLVVLPGSRRSEVDWLLDPFGETVALIAAKTGPLDVVLPTVPGVASAIRERTAKWKPRPVIVEGEAAKFAAFRRAHAALAASGTVTLELALAGVPMAVAYRVDAFFKLIKRYVTAQMQGPVKSIVLPNLILAEKAIPEFIDGDGTPERLAGAVIPLLADSPERTRQIDAFRRLDGLMSLGQETPSGLAASVVLETVRRKGQRRLEIGS